jgi:uncharacterized protein with GYD domain
MQKEIAMPAYVVLGNFTDEGIRNIKRLTELRQAAEQWATAHNGRIVVNYTTFGQYDFVVIVELPSPDVALEGAFTFGKQGQLRTQTLMGFASAEAEAVAQRIP